MSSAIKFHAPEPFTRRKGQSQPRRALPFGREHSRYWNSVTFAAGSCVPARWIVDGKGETDGLSKRRLTRPASAETAFGVLRQDHFDVPVRARDDVDAHQLADALGGGSSRVGGSFDRADVA